VPIARTPSVVLDCSDPRRLAEFYGALLGWKVSANDEWADIRPPDGSNCICFQRVDRYTPPRWPGQEVPQQLHLDLIVDDLDAGEVVALQHGATKTEYQPGETFRVYLDPAGHPFCLCNC
jgi:predicted enzyme related to lactoylglutathione lyase